MLDPAVRYDRQMLIPGFGPEGQAKLARATVLVAGAGGLGSPASIYLAAAGVGRIILVDSDVVELSNLNRQILHWEGDVGRLKVDSAKEKLTQLNSSVKIEPRKVLIEAGNVRGLVVEADLVLDAMDNFPTRRLLNQACVEIGRPFIYGGIHGLTGMVSFFKPGETACLNCLFPGDVPREKFPVLGTTPGMVACLQVTEAIKHLVGLGRTLADRLLIYNGLEMTFQEVRIGRNPDCRVCGHLRP